MKKIISPKISPLKILLPGIKLYVSEYSIPIITPKITLTIMFVASLFAITVRYEVSKNPIEAAIFTRKVRTMPPTIPAISPDTAPIFQESVNSHPKIYVMIICCN
jgi:hypothetical protein